MQAHHDRSATAEPAAPAVVQEIWRDSGAIAARVGNLIFAVAIGPSNIAGMEATRAATLDVLRDYPSGFMKLIVTAAGTPMPGADARARARTLTGEFAAKTLGLALVFEGDGTWYSMMLTVSSTMLLALPSKFPRRMFGRCEEAALWLHSSNPATANFSTTAALSAISTYRTQLGFPLTK